MKRQLKHVGIAVMLLPLVFCASCSSTRGFLTHGGLTTMMVRDEVVGRSKKVNRAHFTSAEEAIRAKDGCIYVRVTGRLEYDPPENVTYVVELPVGEMRKEYQAFETKQRHVQGFRTRRLRKGNLHRGLRYWEKIKKKSASSVTIETINDKSEIDQADQHVFFEVDSSALTYTENSAIHENDIYWMRFNPSPKIITKRWPLVFIPITYVFDILTSPFQYLLCKYVQANT